MRIMRKIVLASSSPRRKEILERFLLDFKIVPSEVDEEFIKSEDPKSVVKCLALEKCRCVAKRCTDGEIVIAADTLVYKEEILGKPINRSDAFSMIRLLSGDTHQVLTGICIIDSKSGTLALECEVTDVVFRDLTDEKIERYLDTREYIDKAGAYGIQGYGEVLVKSINGSFSNVVGLPISKLDEMLEDKFNLKLL